MSTEELKQLFFPVLEEVNLLFSRVFNNGVPISNEMTIFVLAICFALLFIFIFSIYLLLPHKSQNEKKRKKFLDGVPISLPALTRASRIQEKAAQVGFDWQDIDPIWDKVYEEIDELKTAISSKNEDEVSEELGDVLFSIVNLSRYLNTSPESALKKTINKFEKRFHYIECKLQEKNISLSDASLEEMDEFWNKSKKI